MNETPIFSLIILYNEKSHLEEFSGKVDTLHLPIKAARITIYKPQ